jgi:predicted nucleotide-binding protein (sugar kinase/HSP70/actin superfamily)
MNLEERIEKYRSTANHRAANDILQLKEIYLLCKQYHNDMDLGREIRRLITSSNITRITLDDFLAQDKQND